MASFRPRSARGATSVEHQRVLGVLQGIKRNLAPEAAKALYEETLIESNESARRTPFKTGDLRKSRRIHGPIINGADISTQITFGNEGVDYAVPVHENLEAFHPVGQAKYLESTLDESRPHMPARIGRRIEFNRLARR